MEWGKENMACMEMLTYSNGIKEIFPPSLQLIRETGKQLNFVSG